MKPSPIGGTFVAPLRPGGLLVFADFLNFCILPILFLSLHFIFQFCSRYPPMLEALVFVVTVFSNLSF